MFKIKRFYVKTANPYYSNELIVHLRGHVRDSFNNPQLYLFLKKLSHFTLKIYIHTWNVTANQLSWQQKNFNPIIITEQMIRDYFKDLPITSIIIDDDQHIQLIGNTTGNMFSSKMPKLGWKNMWYGMYASMKQIYEHEKDNVLILNMRFDAFTNCCKVTEHDLIKWIWATIDKIKYQKISTNFFIQDELKYGIDNQIIGDKYTLYKLIYYFHHHLDDIHQKYIFLKNQEYSVYHENNRLF